VESVVAGELAAADDVTECLIGGGTAVY